MIANIIQTLCIYALPVILAITLHEAAHGYVALRLGDPTAKRLGRVTLDPLAHIDPVGTVAVPVGLLLMSAFTGGGFIFGWAKPVPVNPNYFKNFNRGWMLVALAGPAANLLQAVLWALVLKAVVIFGITEPFFANMAVAGISVNLMLMAFNLIPIPPLDGGRILRGLMPETAVHWLDRIEPYGMVILIVLMVGGGLSYFVRPFLMLGQWFVHLVI